MGVEASKIVGFRPPRTWLIKPCINPTWLRFASHNIGLATRTNAARRDFAVNSDGNIPASGKAWSYVRLDQTLACQAISLSNNFPGEVDYCEIKQSSKWTS